MMKPLKGMGFPVLPDRFVQMVTPATIDSEINPNLPDEVCFQKWQRVDVEDVTSEGDRHITKKLRIVDHTTTKDDFLAALRWELEFMTGHIYPVSLLSTAVCFT